jgi:hypothetical protein
MGFANEKDSVDEQFRERAIAGSREGNFLALCSRRAP